MNAIAETVLPARFLDEAPAGMIRARLAEARWLALRGEPERARLLCAESVLGWLPWICRDAELLQNAIATLFMARGFEMLRRLLAAAQGRRVRFAAIPADAPSPDPKGITEVSLGDGTTVFRFADDLLEHPARERLVNAWSRRLVGPEPVA
jgi:hypothetical protein